MTIVLVILVGFILMSLLISGCVMIHSRIVYGLPYGRVRVLSTASREIIRYYLSLPEANRPYANIYTLLTALDTKYKADDVSQHFKRRGYERSYFTWTCVCQRRKVRCTFEEYGSLAAEINGITEALDIQEHQLRVAAVEGNLSQVEELTARLREERQLIDSVTKELCS